jgi:Uncharacterized protein conserved in bacteria (DUF2125)
MPAKSPPSRFRLLLWLLPLALLMAAAAHAAWWWHLSRQLEAGFATWAAARQAEGWVVEHGTPARGGWPRAALLVLPEPRLAAPNGVTWQGGRLELRLDLPWPDRLRLAATGPQVLLLDDRRLDFTATDLTGSLPLQAAPLPSEGELRAEGLRAEVPDGPLALRDAALRFASLPDGAVMVDMALAGLNYPPLAPLLGPVVQRLAVRVSSQPVPPLPIARRVAQWRAMGGRLELHDLDVRWGPLQVGGSARFELDPALQPTGGATLELTGLPETLRAATAAGLLTPSGASGLGVMAALLQRSGGGGEPPRVHLPLTLANRRLAVAGFDLLQLPPLRWPAE